MDRIDVRVTTNGQHERHANSSSSSPDRLAAMAALIQKTRSLSSLPLSAGEELRLAVTTWANLLAEIPDQFLGASWDRAVKDHDWSRPFPVPAIINGYKALLVEDRDNRARQQYGNTRRADGTLACYHCEDTGYAPIATYCPTGNEWYFPVYPCHCNATPISQRGPNLVRSHWDKNDRGQWVPTSASESPRCRCGFCKNKGVA